MVSPTAYHTVRSNSKSNGLDPSIVEESEAETTSTEAPTPTPTADEEAPSHGGEGRANSFHDDECFTRINGRTFWKHGNRDHDPTLDSLVCHLCCCGLFRCGRLSCIYWGFVQPVLRCLQHARWMLARPLQTPVLPRRLLYCCCNPKNQCDNYKDATTKATMKARGLAILDRLLPALGVPFCGGTWYRALQYLTYGRLLLGLWISWWVAKKVHYTYTGLAQEGQAVGMSGVYATLLMWAAFGTAFKANNTIPALCCGSSFVDLIPWHAVTSALTLALGIWHGVLAYQRWGLTMTFEGDGGRLASALNGTNATTATNTTEVYTVAYDSIANTTSYTARLGVDYGLAIGTGHPWPFLWDGWINWSGVGLVLAFAALVFSSWFPQLRRAYYRPWFLLHLASCFATLCFGWVHFRIVLPLLVAWGLDWATRYGVLARGKYAGTTATIAVVPGTNLVKLSWPRQRGGCLDLDFNYQPGQFVKVAVPSLGCSGTILDFHPISLASSPHQDEVQVLVRPLGPWSERLHRLALSLTRADASEGADPSDASSAVASVSSLSSLSDHDEDVENYRSTGAPGGRAKAKTGARSAAATLPILVEGPYGSHALEYPRRPRPTSFHEPYVALFVSGGVGVAPMQSIALDMLHWHDRSRRRRSSSVRRTADVGGLVKLRFVWSVRELELVESILDPDLAECSLLDRDGDSPLVETEIYHTRGRPEGDDESDASSGAAAARIRSGRRPDLDALFRRTGEDAVLRDVRRVLVFCCGPAALTDRVEDLCGAHSAPARDGRRNCFRYRNLEVEGGGSGRGATFELHKEVFEF